MVRTETLKNQLKPDWGAFILGWVRQSPATNPVSPNCRSLISPFYLPRTKVSVLGYMSFSKLAYCCKIWYLSSASVLYRNLQNRKDFIEVAKRAVFEIQKSSHLQPLAATRVAASGRNWPVAQPVGFEISKAASLALFASFAATCSHLQPLAATRVAASGRKWPLGQVAARGRLLYW